MKSSVAVLCVLRLKRLLLVCLCGEAVSVRCRPPSSLPCRAPASNMHRRCSVVNHSMPRSCASWHRCGAPVWGIFDPPRLPISVGRFRIHDMHIFNVNKCTYLYGQPPSSALCHPTKTLPTWGNVGEYNPLRLCVFALCRSSVSGRRSSVVGRCLPVPLARISTNVGKCGVFSRENPNSRLTPALLNRPSSPL